MIHCHLLTAGSLHAIHVGMRQAHLPVCSHPNKKKTTDLIILLYFWCSFKKSFISACLIAASWDWVVFKSSQNVMLIPSNGNPKVVFGLCLGYLSLKTSILMNFHQKNHGKHWLNTGKWGCILMEWHTWARLFKKWIMLSNR